MRAYIPLLVVIGLGRPARSDLQGDEFSSRAWQIRMRVPASWQALEAANYPGILLEVVRRDPDGKMLLTAEKVQPGTSVRAYLERTLGGLHERFTASAPISHAGSGALVFDLDYCQDSACKSKRFLRQAIWVRAGFAYSLTLAAADLRTRSQHLRSFDFALRSLRFD